MTGDGTITIEFLSLFSSMVSKTDGPVIWKFLFCHSFCLLVVFNYTFLVIISSISIMYGPNIFVIWFLEIFQFIFFCRNDTMRCIIRWSITGSKHIFYGWRVLNGFFMIFFFLRLFVVLYKKGNEAKKWPQARLECPKTK